MATAEAHESAGTRRGTGGRIPASRAFNVKLRGRAVGCAAEQCARLAKLLQRGGKRRVRLDPAAPGAFFQTGGFAVEVS